MMMSRLRHPLTGLQPVAGPGSERIDDGGDGDPGADHCEGVGRGGVNTRIESEWNGGESHGLGLQRASAVWAGRPMSVSVKAGDS